MSLAPTATRTPTQTRAYRGGRLVAQGFPLADVSDHLETDGCTVWVDLTDPTPADFDALEDELGLHQLAVEDALHDGQRPKVDRYENHLFTALYDVAFDPASGELSTNEVKAFVTARALVTIHHPEFDASRLETAWTTRSRASPTTSSTRRPARSTCRSARSP
jgi:magnesium transporter